MARGAAATACGGSHPMRHTLRIIGLGLWALLTGCVTSTVDEMVFNEPIEGIGDSTVVILGRRHASDYETEFDFIECIADHVVARDSSIEIIDEIEFINNLYPWFEPRTAPLRPADIAPLFHPTD